jgi:hypothetical protein
VQAGQQVAQSDLDSVARCVALLIRQSPGLRSVIEAWPNLPAAVKAGIVAMVRASHD